MTAQPKDPANPTDEELRAIVFARDWPYLSYRLAAERALYSAGRASRESEIIGLKEELAKQGFASLEQKRRSDTEIEELRADRQRILIGEQDERARAKKAEAELANAKAVAGLYDGTVPLDQWCSDATDDAEHLRAELAAMTECRDEQARHGHRLRTAIDEHLGTPGGIGYLAHVRNVGAELNATERALHEYQQRLADAEDALYKAQLSRDRLRAENQALRVEIGEEGARTFDSWQQAGAEVRRLTTAVAEFRAKFAAASRRAKDLETANEDAHMVIARLRANSFAAAEEQLRELLAHVKRRGPLQYVDHVSEVCAIEEAMVFLRERLAAQSPQPAEAQDSGAAGSAVAATGNEAVNSPFPSGDARGPVKITAAQPAALDYETAPRLEKGVRYRVVDSRRRVNGGRSTYRLGYEFVADGDEASHGSDGWYYCGTIIEHRVVRVEPKQAPLERAIERAKNMTSAEVAAVSVRAGIHNADGTLTERFGGEPAKCERCGGEGTLPYHERLFPADESCAECNGTGEKGEG